MKKLSTLTFVVRILPKKWDWRRRSGGAFIVESILRSLSSLCNHKYGALASSSIDLSTESLKFFIYCCSSKETQRIKLAAGVVAVGGYMSSNFYSFLEALSFYALWMLSVCSTIDLFRETRGNGPISRWGKVLAVISILSTMAAFVYTVLIGESTIA